MEHKYKLLKKKLKEVIEENDRVNERLKKAQYKVQILTCEKSLLLDRLDTLDPTLASSDTELSDTPSSISELSAVDPDADVPTETPKKTVQQTSDLLNTTPEQEKKGAKRVRRKTGDVPMKIRKIQDIGRDKEGHPQLPVQLGIITLESLGEISTASGFHNDRYIYPIGFTTSRQYLSMIDAEKTVTYRSTIISTPDGPKFQVVAEDDPTHPIIAQSATGAWTAVLRAANKLRNKEHSNSASGPDYFGLSQPTIINLIQGLPNADKCTQYTFQKFEIASKKADRTTNKTKKAIRARELSSEEARDNKPFSDPMEMSVLEGNIPNMESLNAKVIDFNPNQIQPVVDNSASGMN